MEYNEFLKTKEYSYQNTGFDIDESELNENLFPFQKKIVQWALKKGKCALFLDTGLGKTICQLSFADAVCKHENGKALILAPLAVSKQTKHEGEKFGINVNICRKQEDVKDGVNITNYEMLQHFNPSEFCCVVLDESSILKSFMGKTKRLLCDILSDIPYKMACTATPAPNDTMEILNHAEFLSVMRSSEALAIWFIADQSAMGNYRLKAHAVDDFYRWVSSWAIGINKPSDIGFSDDGYILPDLKENNIICGENQFLGSMNIQKASATNYNRLRRNTIDIRCSKCAEIANSSNEQYLIWCDLNDEARLLKKLIPDAVEISGSDKAEKKEDAAVDFASGKIRVLISKPLIFGFGLNFQNCHNIIFCGLSYSYENYYQAVRRCWRFGQKNSVNVDRIITQSEKYMLDTLNAKSNNHREFTDSMTSNMKNYQLQTGTFFKLDLSEHRIEVPSGLKEEN